MPRRRFGREEKLAAVKRMLARENVVALSRELKVSRKMLYDWRAKYLAGGAAALRGAGQPRKVMEVEPPPELGGAAPPLPPHAELVKARARIAELERKIGRQQLELDFFQQALRQVGERRQPSDEPGVKTSTPSSRR
jgi:transposase-like protein